MKTFITLRDVNDPLKDMGAITVSDNEGISEIELPWYFEDEVRVVGFAPPNDMTADNDVYILRRGEWEDKIEGLTPIFTEKGNMYQRPHIIVAGVESD